jgi:hypothetical protein
MALPDEILIIPPSYVKKLTMLNGSVDDNFVRAAMYIAQDKWVQPSLGDALMEKIKTDTQDNSIAGDYITLRDLYMAKPVVWWTMVELMPNLTYKMDNGTLVQRTSEDSQSVTDVVMKDMIDRCRHNADYYTKRLNEYLCANSSLFPELATNSNEQRGPIAAKNTTPQFSISSGNSASSRPTETLLNRYLP